MRFFGAAFIESFKEKSCIEFLQGEEILNIFKKNSFKSSLCRAYEKIYEEFYEEILCGDFMKRIDEKIL